MSLTLTEPRRLTVELTDKWYYRNSEPFAFQLTEAKEGLECLLEHGVHLLQSGVGTGKTYMSLMIATKYVNDYLKQSPASGFHSPKILVVTPKAVCKNFRDDAAAFFGLTSSADIQIISYSSLRSTLGKAYVDEVKREDINANEAEDTRITCFKWKDSIKPGIIIFDECHSMNNIGSLQHELGVTACNLLQADLLRKTLNVPPHLAGTKLLFMSATPATKACHLDVIMRARLTANPKSGVFFGKDMGKPYLDICERPLPFYWHNRAKALMIAICGGADPYTLSNTAMQRMAAFIDPITRRVPPITTKWKNKMAVKLYDPSADEAEQIRKAVDDYIKELAQLGKEGPGAARMKMVAMLKLRMRCEIVRAPLLAKLIAADVSSGIQPVVGVEFKNTIARIVLCLVRDYGFTREQLCLVWGGDDIYTKEEVNIDQDELFKLVAAALNGEAYDSSKLDAIIDQVKINYSGMKEDIAELQRLKINLNSQTTEERNAEIEELQCGRRLVCLASFKAGCIGINLNHSDKYFRIRGDQYHVTLMPNTKHGMSVTDKEGNPVTVLPLPRKGYMAPTWSPLNFLQFKGRAHRIDSISHTSQEVVLYKGTIEEAVALTLGKHFMNARTLAKANEDWACLLEDAVFGKYNVGATETTTTTEDTIDETEDTGEE